ncbi:serine/threonine-protein phosphatase 7 long form homolog [Arachis hypogaea]|uniref:serine/threonine-protein phosphatase 7 long form homolog n=1 Tax=Arachis hypogaea TaxID=3818 RepID=UPI003B2103C4
MARQVGNDGDINRLNETTHYAGATDFERPCLLLPRRVSHTLPPPDAIVPYLDEAGFSDTMPLRNFIFDNSLISALVEQRRLETHRFYLSWDEVTITLQDVVYHLGLRAHGNPVGGCLCDFGRWYAKETWVLVEQLLGARPPVAAHQATQRKESFTLKLVWLRNRVRQMPQTDDPETLRQYAKCYIMLLIEGYLMTDKSNNLVHLRWLPLLRDFAECKAFSWGSAVLAWTYQSLSLVAQRGVTDIAGCTPLLMS